MKFSYQMPTQVFFGMNCVRENAAALSALGQKALIVTGKHSAQACGALDDVKAALTAQGRDYVWFNQVEENPRAEVIAQAAALGREAGCDFVIGIGGGSPMDAAKAAALLLANPDESTDCFLERRPLAYAPLALLPTTAGTGSEVTQYAIVTFPEKQTKISIFHTLFAQLALVDPNYLAGLGVETTRNTAVDALTHFIEAYLSTKANVLSDGMAEQGFALFRGCLPCLRAGVFTAEDRERLMLCSMLAGMTIAQAGTSLPHGLGYALTVDKGIPHGRANGILTPAYLASFQDQTKVQKLLGLLGFESIAGLGAFLQQVLRPREAFTAQDVARYTAQFMENPAKLAAHPEPMSEAGIAALYTHALLD